MEELQEWKKTEAEVLDYVFDWKAKTNGQKNAVSDYLQTDETIVTALVEASSTDITVGTMTLISTNTAVQVWLSGGLFGQEYEISCKITTTAGRTAQRWALLKIRKRSF